MDKELISIIVNNLGLTGFILFLFFTLLSIYVKNRSERKVLLYVFSFISVSAALTTLYVVVISEQGKGTDKKVLPEGVNLTHKYKNVKADGIKHTIKNSQNSGSKVEVLQDFDGVTVKKEIILNVQN